MGMTNLFFEKILCIDCLDPWDKGLQKLRKVMLDLSKIDLEFWGKLMPSRWMLLEDKLVYHKLQGHRVMTLDEVERMNQGSELPLESREELFGFFETHHDIGTLMHFMDRGLQDMIILDAQWLIDSLKTIITAEIFRDSKYKKEWNQLNEKGIVTKQFVELIWRENATERFYEFKDQLLLLMVKMDLLSSPRKYDENGQHITSSYYVVPCMLQLAPSNFLLMYKDDRTSLCPALIFQFEDDFLPKATVYRLLATSVMQYGESDSSNTMVYSDAAVFKVFKDHFLVLEVADSYLEATVMYSGEGVINVEVCQGVREFIEDILTCIIKAQHTATNYITLVKMRNIEKCQIARLKWNDLLIKTEITCRDDTHKPRHLVMTNDILRHWLILTVSLNFKFYELI